MERAPFALDPSCRHIILCVGKMERAPFALDPSCRHIILCWKDGKSTVRLGSKLSSYYIVLERWKEHRSPWFQAVVILYCVGKMERAPFALVPSCRHIILCLGSKLSSYYIVLTCRSNCIHFFPEYVCEKGRD